ncbi:formylmethanofuran dehydrogenase subunit E region [Solidesulfovibrio fructosivorans JJ]]|uniref:Formylmethanofuran dehydrogenase subunit E region n=1 Tax=Solidesulfovibrio fructosivorans JJ] TaxID=596151 RepID=E1JRN7_SOLFR|nr:formylmethanofuran dehydrogenase subunit E region [Solidesulfovibrio fructosivorans JJ]]
METERARDDVATLTTRAVDYHGHMCPGLAIGIQAARIGLAVCGHDGDEDVVAVVETDMCAVDAIQALMGCTYGKGNLIHRDYGKNAFTFHRRRDGVAVRLLARPDLHKLVDPEFAAVREILNTDPQNAGAKAELPALAIRCAKRILESDPETFFTRTEPARVAPRRAAILSSLVCEACGESVMESRTRRFAGKTLCIPCFMAVEQKI